MKKEDVKVATITLKEFFENHKNLIVPGYQRPYEWGDDQIKKLLDDITESFNKKPDDIILLGSIQLNAVENNGFEIIDGHQRITTLYLLQMFLEVVPDIEYKNEINGSTSIEDLTIKDKVYTENYAYIKKYFKDSSNTNKCALLSFINNNVSFISITIEKCTSIEDTLKVFNALNTTGLQLQIKDIFKIKFAEYLKNNNSCDDKIFERINKSYEDVLHPIDLTNSEDDYNKYDAIYGLDEIDLLDTYRFYMMSTEGQQSWTTDLRNSSNAYFIGIFEGKKHLKLCIDDFCNVAKCIKLTQQRLLQMDQVATNKNEIMNNCCKELLDWSGYERLKNLYYYLVYMQWKEEKDKVTDDMIKNTNEVMSIVWKYCAINRLIYSKIINDVFSTIGDLFFKKEDVSGIIDFYTIKTRVLKKDFYRIMCQDPYFDSFKSLLFINSNVYNCNKPHLLLVLSYIDDIDDTAPPYEIKRDLLYRSKVFGKWGLDIEHILSQKTNKNEAYLNSIGNLLYLTSNTNKYLGTQTKEINDNEKEKDFEIKVRIYNARDDSKMLICVKRFIEEYANSITFIKQRDCKKAKFLRDVFEYEEFFNGKNEE